MNTIKIFWPRHATLVESPSVILGWVTENVTYCVLTLMPFDTVRSVCAVADVESSMSVAWKTQKTYKSLAYVRRMKLCL